VWCGAVRFVASPLHKVRVRWKFWTIHMLLHDEGERNRDKE
jgi:hypothetical protein